MEIDSIEIEDSPMVETSGVVYLLLGGRMVKIGRESNISTKMNIYGVFTVEQDAFDAADSIYAADRDAAIKFREEAVIVHLGYPAYHPDVIKEMAPMRAKAFLPDWQSNFRGGFVTVNPAAENWLRVQTVPIGKIFGKRPWTP